MTATISQFRRPIKSSRNCSFCTKNLKDVGHMFVADNVAAICNECVDLAKEMIAAKIAERDTPDAPSAA